MGFALSSCATKYQEPPRSETRNAVIEAVVPVWIASIDGKAVSQATISGVKRCAILPGSHVLEIKYLDSFGNGERTEIQTWDGQRHIVRVRKFSKEDIFLPFAATEGHHYYAHGGAETTLWKPYINETPPNTFLDLPVH